MNQTSTQGSGQKKFLGIIFLLAVIAVIGFFIYPAIIYQKGPPAAPTNLQGSAGDGEVTLIWTPSESIDPPIISHTIRIKDDKNEVNISTESSDTTYKVTDLENGKEYVFSVSARNEFGDSAFTGTVKVTPDGKGGSGDNNLAGVTDFTGTGDSSSIIFTWSVPESRDLILGQVIMYKQAGNEEYITVDVGSGGVYKLEGLKENTEYLANIYVRYETGDSDPSEEISVFTTDSSGGGGGEEEEELTFSSQPNVVTTNASAQITWGTAKSASSQVYYGATDNMGYMTEEMNTTPRVKGHTVTLNGLVACTVYVYKVASFDDAENGIESTSGEFTTTGCKGDATVITAEKGKVTASSGVTLNAKEAGRGLSVVVPAAVVIGKEVAIQALKVTKEEVKQEISKPEGKTWVGGSYVLNAIEDATTEVTSFDKPVSVSIDYQNADIVGINPSTLKIWHYEDGSGWRQLSSCSTQVNGVGGTVTCQTTSFSVFGIFGDSSDGGDGAGGQSSSSGSPSSTSTMPIKVVDPNVPTTPSIDTKFTKDLWYQVKDAEVKMLQKFLNLKGFTISQTGAGAPGEETDYFGPKTKEALIKFQEAYRVNILAPIGLTVGTGFFGPQTRNFVNSLTN